MKFKLEYRKKIERNTDPQRRCYNGCYFSSVMEWTEWQLLFISINDRTDLEMTAENFHRINPTHEYRITEIQEPIKRIFDMKENETIANKKFHDFGFDELREDIKSIIKELSNINHFISQGNASVKETAPIFIGMTVMQLQNAINCIGDLENYINKKGDNLISNELNESESKK